MLIRYELYCVGQQMYYMEGDKERVVMIIQVLFDEYELFIKTMDTAPTVLPVVVWHSIHSLNGIQQCLQPIQSSDRLNLRV
jgi:hypothetical protein